VHTSTTPDWAITLAGFYKIPYTAAQALLADGKLPTLDRVPRDPAIANLYHDAKAVAALEAYRAQFDTPLPQLIVALDTLAGSLLDGNSERPHERALTEFRRFTADSGSYYPLTPRHHAWRGLRAPVTRAELEAAGYRQLVACWDRPGLDAFRARGGECRLGPERWSYWQPTMRPDLRAPRGAFLARLAHVLSQRSVCVA
jgi:hypothetical protein